MAISHINGIDISTLSHINGIDISTLSHYNGQELPSGGAEPSTLTSLISYWDMDEANGDAVDAHGSDTLIDNNTVGASGGARDFEASSTEYFFKTDNANLSTGDIDFTVQARVNFESFADCAILTKWASGSLEYGLFYLTADYGNGSAANRLHFGVSHNGSDQLFVPANNFGAISTATWYTVHGWHDAANNVIGISVNGGTANTSAHSTGVNNGTAAFCVGAQDVVAGESPYDGLMQHCGLWKRVLTAGNRTFLHNGNAGREYSALV
jgi:hypothetical protein